ncbi:MAG: DNA repair protein RecO [Flavobacteriales bacterium]
MLITTEGIVIHSLKYGDTSVIVRIFTPEHGLVSLLYKAAYKKGRAKGVLQPLNIVEVVFIKKEDKSLFLGKEANLNYPYKSINTNFLKNSVGIFISEFLQKVLKIEETDSQTYFFVKNSLQEFDEQSFSPFFHLWFLSNFLKFAGFAPLIQNLKEYKTFSLSEGVFSHSIDFAPHDVLEGESLHLFKQLLGNGLSVCSALSSHYKTRQELLGKLLTYYHIHMPEMGEMSSHKILHDILQ